MTLSPKDYCLIPGNFAIKLVETQKSPIVNHFQFWFWPDILQVHRSTSNKMDISPDIDPTEISEFQINYPNYSSSILFRLLSDIGVQLKKLEIMLVRIINERLSELKHKEIKNTEMLRK